MIITRLAVTLLAGIGAGCSAVPAAPVIASSALPNCFESSFDAQRNIFTMKNERAGATHQQCLLTVRPYSMAVAGSNLAAGNYRIYIANGGGGGAGGTTQSRTGTGGGGGGGGAGSIETQAIVDLPAGDYKLTLGAGGPGGNACMPRAGFGGGPGWVGSPSNMIRVATGELIAGTAGADSYVRPSRAQNERIAGKLDGHGGSGPGQTSGGHAAVTGTTATTTKAATPTVPAEAGASLLASGSRGQAGAAGSNTTSDGRPGGGGGGGATAAGSGGSGGGESPGQLEQPPQRGSLGGGGGGGEGSTTECDPGARGGHGYIALRKI